MPKIKRFKREKRVYHLKFETPELEGFECYCTGTTLQRFVEFTALFEQMSTAEGRTEENIKRQAGDHLPKSEEA